MPTIHMVNMDRIQQTHSKPEEHFENTEKTHQTLGELTRPTQKDPLKLTMQERNLSVSELRSFCFFVSLPFLCYASAHEYILPLHLWNLFSDGSLHCFDFQSKVLLQ